MAQRRRGTVPQRVRLTQELADLVDRYQEQHDIPSFSAALEQLARLGLEQSPAETLAPVIVSTIRRSIHAELERVIKLLLYAVVEAGTAQRLAGAAVRDIGRLKGDDPERYQRIKRAAVADARRRLRRTHVQAVINELYEEVIGGDRAGELHHAGERSTDGGEEGVAGGEILHGA